MNIKSTATSTADDATSMVDTAARVADQAIRTSQRVANETIDQVAERADGFRQQAGDTLHRWAADAQSLTRRGVDAVRDGSQQLRQQASRASDSTAGYIKDEPFKSILIAAAVGAGLMALIGLMSRSRD